MLKSDFYLQADIILVVFLASVWGAVIAGFVQRLALEYERAVGKHGCVDARVLMDAIRQSAHLRFRTTSLSNRSISSTGGSQERASGVLVAPFLLSASCTALGLAGLYLRHGFTPYFFLCSLAAILLLALALIDARTGLLPDALTFPLLWLGIGTSWFGWGVSLSQAVGGVFLGFGFLWSISQLFSLFNRRDGMGGGDLKLLAAAGAWVGIHSVPWVLLAACLAGIFFVMLRQRTWRPAGAIAFGPFLAAATVGVFLFPSAVHSWFW